MTHLTLDTAATQWAVDGKLASAPHALTALAGGSSLLVLMHGLGSHEKDLIQLASFLPKELVIASLRAPLKAAEVDATLGGWSWFPLSLQPGGVSPEQGAAEAVQAAQAVIDWVHQLKEQVGGIRQIAPMGFSQGGVMTTTMLRLAPGEFVCGVNCSGYIAPGEFMGDAALKDLQTPLFWGRDLVDPAIGHAAVELTAAWAPQHTALEAHTYKGIGHSIGRTELSDIHLFLTRHFGF
ncbi:alpha/beta hydrolase [Canibacter zhoujuaniae]|uniref:alpha/beta hydrolase n=1 Tax=Canibacter zhoujuaniae TaxID=2708343 RepID=UPI00142421FB|nr:phospholipase [Canibacter zhoujuaniae]